MFVHLRSVSLCLNKLLDCLLLPVFLLGGGGSSECFSRSKDPCDKSGTGWISASLGGRRFDARLSCWFLLEEICSVNCAQRIFIPDIWWRGAGGRSYRGKEYLSKKGNLAPSISKRT